MLWLITGCSSGIGLDLARSVLAAGHQCIATSRNPSSSPEVVSEIKAAGGVWAQLDVSSPQVAKIIDKIIKEHGPIDVLINNAGFSAGGIFEYIDISEAQRMFETNFWGPARIIQSIIPIMRERKSGTIVNISSATVWLGYPTTTMYSASKAALEQFSECLAGELAPFGVRVLLIEPGSTRTKFLDSVKQPANKIAIPEPYKGTPTEYVISGTLQLAGNEPQDPRKTADAVVKEITSPCSGAPLLRLPLGKQSLEAIQTKASALLAIGEAVKDIAPVCDF